MSNGIKVDADVLTDLLSVVQEIRSTNEAKEKAAAKEMAKNLEITINKLQTNSKTDQDVIDIVKENLPLFTDKEHIRELIRKCNEDSKEDAKKLIEIFRNSLTPKFVDIVRREIKLFFSPTKIILTVLSIILTVTLSIFGGTWYLSSELSRMDTKIEAIELSHTEKGDVGRRLKSLEDREHENDKILQRRLGAIEGYIDKIKTNKPNKTEG